MVVHVCEDSFKGTVFNIFNGLQRLQHLYVYAPDLEHIHKDVEDRPLKTVFTYRMEYSVYIVVLLRSNNTG